ncbi:MAG: hypothetical protein HY335_05790 [Deinococcus sp.]|nr:hypothetical protein [Deinococcus sp.]
MAQASENPGAREGDIDWRSIWIGCLVALAGTLALGGGLFLAYENLWWVALAGLVSLLVGGFIAGFRAKTAEPLNGAFIAVFYFAFVVAILFGGEVAGVLPEPLPGLPRGDSTFFFVWPLEQLASATVGAALGGWVSARR